MRSTVSRIRRADRHPGAAPGRLRRHGVAARTDGRPDRQRARLRARRRAASPSRSAGSAASVPATTSETQVPTEEAVVAAFNEEHDDIELIFEMIDYDEAYDALAVQIAGGNPPDILGPVGGTGAAAFEGEWLDLTDADRVDRPRPVAVLGGVGRVLPGRGAGPGRPAVRHLPVDAVLPALDVRRGRPRVSAAGVR